MAHFGILSRDCLQESNKTVGVEFLWMSLRNGWIYLWLSALARLREAEISPSGPKQVLHSWVPLLGIVCHSSICILFCLLTPLAKFLRPGSDQLLSKAEKWEATGDISSFNILRYFCSPSDELVDWNRDEVLWFLLKLLKLHLILLRTVVRKDKDSEFFTYNRLAVGVSQVLKRWKFTDTTSYNAHFLSIIILAPSSNLILQTPEAR